jgi:hypothetical protein
MNFFGRNALVLSLLIASPMLQLSATEFSAKIADGLGRPIPGVEFNLGFPKHGAGTKDLVLFSDENGFVHGAYHQNSFSAHDLSVFLTKEGYEGYSTGLKNEYVLKRVFHPKDIHRVGCLRGRIQREKLKEILAGEFESKSEDDGLDDIILFNESQLRKALQSCLKNEKTFPEAARLLALIGYPEDLRLILRHAPGPRHHGFENRWAYSVVSTLPDISLVEAAKKVAQAIKIGEWQKNGQPRFNAEGNIALVDIEFIEGRDSLIYTATFHQVKKLWECRGVRETMQALLAFPPERKEFFGAWHGYSDSHLLFARLELAEDGTGVFVLSELPQYSPDRYRVTKWTPNKFNLEIVLEPTDPDAEPITLEKIRLGIDSLELEIHGKGWSRKLSLLNEAEFQQRAQEVKDWLHH